MEDVVALWRYVNPDICLDNLEIEHSQYKMTINPSFLDTIIGCVLSQMVNEPTREHSTSSSPSNSDFNLHRLDLISTNLPDQVSRVKVMPGISDHKIVICTNQILCSARETYQKEEFAVEESWPTFQREGVKNLKDRLLREYQNESKPDEHLWTLQNFSQSIGVKMWHHLNPSLTMD